MNKKLIAAVAVLVALLGIYLAIRKDPQRTVRADYTAGPIEGLTRVEITPAAEAPPGAKNTGGEVPDRIVFARRGDAWWITEPVESPLRDGLAEQLDGLFTKEVRADDLRIPADRAAEYQLTDALATRVALFAGDTKALELLVGKQITVERTRAQRTFVKPAGEDRIYRLQAGLGFLNQRDPKSARSKKILDLKSDDVDKITVTHAGQPPLTLSRGEEGEWQLEGDAMRVEQSAANALEGALRNLQAQAIVDDADPKALGLEPPQVTLTAGGQTLHLGASEDQAKFYARRADLPIVYELSRFKHQRLTPTRERLRDLTVRPLERDDIVAIDFAGEDAVRLERDGEVWKMTAPREVARVDPVQLTGTLDFISKIRASRYVEPDLAAQGLDAASKPERVVIHMKDGSEHVLLLGGKRDIDPEGKNYERWAKFADGDEVFVFSKYTQRRFSPKPDSFEPKDDAAQKN